MKIAIVHLSLNTEGGDARMVYLKARALIESGHQVSIFTSAFDAASFSELHQGLDIVVVPAGMPKIYRGGNLVRNVIARLKFYLFSQRAVRAIFDRLEEFDILDCHNDASYKLGFLYKKKYPNARVFWTMNNCPFYRTKKANILFEFASRIYAFTERISVLRHLKSIDVVITNDDEQSEVFLKTTGLSPVLMRIPVDFEDFYQPVRVPFPDAPVVLLSVGSLSPARKFEDTISAVSALKRRGMRSRAVIVCKDFWGNHKYRRLLISLAQSENVESEIEFHFDGVSDAELRSIYSRSSVFVFPNTRRIWGMAAIEAMAAGLPVVVSSSTSIAEVLESGRHALFSKPGDPESIADCIQSLYRDELYRTLASAGQEFVHKNLTWQSYISRYIKLGL